MTPSQEQPATHSLRWRDALRTWVVSPAALLALVATACIIVYSPARNSPFVLDDIRNIVENPNIRMTRLDLPSLWRAMVPYGELNLRPLSFLSFALNHLLGGYNPSGYHAVNLAVLLLSLPVAYLLALRLGLAWRPPREARAIALGATALWVLHPLLTNGISYVVQRMTALYTLFSLAALLLFLRGRQSGRRGPHLLAAVSLLCALASKETALFTPLLAILMLWLLPREEGGAGARAGWLLAGVVAASQAAMFLAAQYALRMDWIPAQPFTAGERLLTEGRVVMHYLGLFLLPLPSRLTFDYDFPVSTSLLVPPSTLAAIMLHAVLIALAVWVRGRRPLVAFGILGFYLLQLPEGTFMPLDLIFEHRAYFPAFFLALALTDLLLWGLGRLATPRPWRVVLGATMALAALAGGFSLQRNRLLADPLLLWRDTVSKAPGSLRVRQQYSLELLKDPRRGEEALEQARIALARWPNSPDANHHLGVVYAWLGRTEKAIPFFEKAAQLSPRSPWVLNSLAYGYSALGRHGEALELCRRAIALSPGYARAHYNLGISLIGLGREAEAMAVWRTLQGIDPTLALRLRTAMPRAGR